MNDDATLINPETPRGRFKRLLKQIETQIGIESDVDDHKQSDLSSSVDDRTEMTSVFSNDNIENGSENQIELDDTAPVKVDVEPPEPIDEEDTAPYLTQKAVVSSRSDKAPTYQPRQTRRFVGCFGRIILALVFIVVL